MSVRKVLSKVTGSGGATPVKDGTTRGILLAAIVEGLNVLSTSTGVLGANDAGDFMALAVLAAFVLGGLWDKFFKAQ